MVYLYLLMFALFAFWGAVALIGLYYKFDDLKEKLDLLEFYIRDHIITESDRADRNKNVVKDYYRGKHEG